MTFIANIIHLLIQALILLVFVDSILSFFLPPYHNVRQLIGRITRPMLAPIQRLLPQTGTIDFSPFVLIVLLILLDQILVRLLISL
jgi:YggT family protein